jgi:hypothetical protein
MAKNENTNRKGFMPVSRAFYTHPRAKVFNQALARHSVLNSWERVIAEFFEDGESQTKAVDFKQGVLLVACLSKELAAKIKLFAQRIIYLLNQALGQTVVYSLQIDY